MKKTVILLCLFGFVTLRVKAQQSTPQRSSALAIEARVTTYIQSGYDLGVYYYPKKSKLSLGLLFASHQINGRARNLVFRSDNHEPLEIRLNWIVSFLGRYHFLESGEGFFGEMGIGIEEFEVGQNDQTKANINGFLAPSVGYIWYPWQSTGFYLLPKITIPFIVSRPDEFTFADGNNFQLKPVFISPSIAIGYKFGL